MQEAKHYAGAGVAEIAKAGAYQHRRRRRHCCVCWLALLATAVGFAPTLVELLLGVADAATDND